MLSHFVEIDSTCSCWKRSHLGMKHEAYILATPVCVQSDAVQCYAANKVDEAEKATAYGYLASFSAPMVSLSAMH